MTTTADGTDAQLARSVAARGADAKQAEGELCRRFAPRIRAYGLRHLRDADAASELTQRVLILVLEKLRAGEVQNAASIASFVLGTARFTARAMRRADQRSMPLSETETPALATSQPTLQLDLRRVASCMGELEPRERMVITMSFFEERAAAEISNVLGLSTGNVRVMRHRALDALRLCFERTGAPA